MLYLLGRFDLPAFDLPAVSIAGAVQTEDTFSSNMVVEEKDSLTLAEPPASEKTANSLTEGST
jgi:hypothetical protein